MKLNIKISESITKRISNLTDSCSGKLYGIITKDNLVIVALHVSQNDFDLTNSLPSGIEFCGILSVGSENQHHNVIPRTVLIKHVFGNDGLSAFIEENGNYKATSYIIITEQEINNTFLYIRLKGEIPLKSEFTASALKETFQNVQKTASLELVFSLLKSNIFLLDNETIGIDSDISLNEFCEESNSFNEEINKKKKVINVKPRILEFNLLQQLTKNNSSEVIKEHAPIGILDKHPFKVIDTLLQIDSLAVVKADTKIQNLYTTLLQSINKLLKLYEIKFLDFVNSNKSTKNLVYEIFHFYPEECQHFLTFLYAKDQSEAELKILRLLLHKQLLLETSAPCFRRSNQYMFDKKPNGPLINPHEGIRATDNGGVIALVRGKYEYYHYCQNKMDDNGWGCAYRSLQTLASWFKLQGFVDRDVPTFAEIQQCLVNIKDKPACFVGSRQWIGSTEVNFVLNTLLGVENKILYVSSGDDMASKGQELVSHFQNHGSPVMIGGGVLAHTILGVDYNQQTGDIRFLILDPHYTGGEDLHTIQSKGWCGWKNANFWDKGSYYNMCLPLVPREV